jgi:hypothetical protein
MKTETKNPRDLTLDECQRWLAKDMGYEFDGKNVSRFHDGWYRMENGQIAYYSRHPISNDLDAATRCLPNGFTYTFERNATGSIFGSAERSSFRFEVSGTDEKLVRFQLAVACRVYLRCV